MELNFNSLVEVRLTETGAAIFDNYKKVAACSTDGTAVSVFEVERALDNLISDGVLRAPLWKLFMIFGPEINAFIDPPFFENEIVIVEEEMV